MVIGYVDFQYDRKLNLRSFNYAFNGFVHLYFPIIHKISYLITNIGIH